MKNSRIAEERQKLGLSQEELASKLNISQKSISKYECGTRRPSFETLLAMASIFGTSTDYLLGNSDNKNLSRFLEITSDELELLNLYKEWHTQKISLEIRTKLQHFFPDVQKSTTLTPTEEKLLSTFKKLNEDNQDIIIGKAKDLLREQNLSDTASYSGAFLKEAN